MVQQAMTVDEHLDTALLFLEQGGAELDAGDLLQGSEKLWGATAHASIAMAERMGWPHGSHRQMKNAVIRFSEQQSDPSLRWLFGLAEKFHRNFYNNITPQFEIDSDREDVVLYVRRMVELMRPSGG